MPGGAESSPRNPTSPPVTLREIVEFALQAPLAEIDFIREAASHEPGAWRMKACRAMACASARSSPSRWSASCSPDDLMTLAMRLSSAASGRAHGRRHVARHVQLGLRATRASPPPCRWWPPPASLKADDEQLAGRW